VSEIRSPKAQLAEHGLRPKRHFGQNFLADRAIAARIAELATPPGATVLELGAGLGALTRPLLERARRVIAVERDRELVPVLAAELSDVIAEGRLEILEADAKALDLRALAARSERPFVLAGNLPYQLTGPLIELAVHAATALDRVVFLVQLEVGERLAAAAGSEAYGALSVFTQAAFDVTRALVVRRGAFYPQPNVDSAVVVLSPREHPVAETAAFAAWVHAAFGQRRKKLANAWRGVLGFDREALAALAERAGIDLSLRGERLAVADFERMARAAEEARA